MTCTIHRLRYTQASFIAVVWLLAACSSATPVPTAMIPDQLAPEPGIPTTTAPSATPTAVRRPAQTIGLAATPTLAICLETSGTSSEETTSTEPLQVAFTKEGDVWHWRKGGAAAQLTNLGDVLWLLLSDDGAVIAFVRGLDVFETPELWAVNTDGSSTRRLLSTDELNSLVRDDPYALGAGFSGLKWVPGTHTLAFDVIPIYDGVGAGPQDALRLIDADTGKQRVLIQPHQAGRFIYSPDGSQIALVSQRAISLINADGSNRRDDLVLYPSVGLGHTAYRPYPVWASDSRSLRVAVPVTEAYDEVMTFAIWDIPADGTSPVELGSLEASGFSIALSPDLNYIASWRSHAPLSNRRDLYIARANGSDAGVYYTGHLIEVLGWAPDSRHFIFWSAPRRAPQLGHICGGFSPLTDTPRAIEVRWVDRLRFLFVSPPERGQPYEQGPWELRLGTVGGASMVIVSIDDRVPAYDFRP